jgi:hypothetical protein
MSAYEAKTEDSDAAPRSPFLPLLTIAAAFLVWIGFQTVELIGERRALVAAHDAQAPQLAESAQLRVSLDAVATGTQKLADGGNANARIIVDELKKRGITISFGKTPEPSPP